VKTDKSELYNFGMQLKEISSHIDPNLFVYPFAIREIDNILAKIHKKIIVPKKTIKAISFNYYEIQVLIFLDFSQEVDPIKHLDFNTVFHKVNSKV
jgi:hypothetical protein